MVPVPEASWGNVSRDLNVYLDTAVVPGLQRKGARVTRRGEAETDTLNGVKFIRLEVDGGWVGRTDRYVLYFGTSRPFLIALHCHCPLDRVDEWLPILEASVRTLRR